MNLIFIQILNNSFIASILILAVIIARLLIKKAPKWFTCALWGLVAIKLIIPFNIPSVYSLMPRSVPLSQDRVSTWMKQPETTSQSNNNIGQILDNVANVKTTGNLIQQAKSDYNLVHIVLTVGSIVWIIGMVLILGISMVSYVQLKKRLKISKKKEHNIYICDGIISPFVMGVIKPQIYLTTGLSEQEYDCVLAHERGHIKRGDHLWKPLGFIVLVIYWFNPFCWLSYAMLCKDIELACDEKVTKNKDKNWKVSYCQALLDCDGKSKIFSACPVAFGEVSVKDRINTIITYKKPAIWMIAEALIIFAILLVCFMTSPYKEVAKAIEVVKNEEVKVQKGTKESTIKSDKKIKSKPIEYIENTEEKTISDDVVETPELLDVSYEKPIIEIQDIENRLNTFIPVDNIFGEPGYVYFTHDIHFYGEEYTEPTSEYFYAYIYNENYEPLMAAQGICFFSDVDNDGAYEAIFETTDFVEEQPMVEVYKKLNNSIFSASELSLFSEGDDIITKAEKIDMSQMEMREYYDLSMAWEERYYCTYPTFN